MALLTWAEHPGQVTTESNHTPIHNGLLFDGVRFWPGQQSPDICVLLRMTLHRDAGPTL